MVVSSDLFDQNIFDTIGNKRTKLINHRKLELFLKVFKFLLVHHSNSLNKNLMLLGLINSLNLKFIEY